MSKHLIDIFIFFIFIFLPIVNTYLIYKILKILQKKEESE